MKIFIPAFALFCLVMVTLRLEDLEHENNQLKEKIDGRCVCNEDYPKSPTSGKKTTPPIRPCLERRDYKGAVDPSSILGR